MKKGKIVVCAIWCALCTAACGESREEEFVEYSISAEKIEESGLAEAEEESADMENSGMEASFYGTWEVKDYQAAAVSALSTEECSAFLGNTVTYQESEVLLNGQKANDGDIAYESEPYTEEALAQDYRANLGEWWNEKTEVSCTTVSSSNYFFGDQFFAADEETIWIFYDGVFFLAKRVEA